jgi:CheY-like chemotaxis protein
MNIPPVRQIDPTLPRAVASIVDRLMQLNPHLRYQSPTEAIRDLRQALVELGQPGGAANRGEPALGDSAAAQTTPGIPLRTVMCLDDRPKHQDLLRDYFGKHGYRVLVLSDLSRGLARLHNQPPDCLIIMGDAFGEEALRGYTEAAATAEARQVGVVLVLPAELADRKSQLPQTDHAKVVQMPATLRDLRNAIATMVD